MNKKQLRAKYKTLRSGLSDKQIEDLSVDIANELLKLPIWDKSFYHVFLPIDQHKEINTEYILNILQGKDKNVIISKSNFEDNTLAHFLLLDTTVLKKNEWGIPEPVDGIQIQEDKIEVIFVPLLAFDTKGNRVGYGKGFYDKFLAKCGSETLKIGLSFFEAEAEIKDVNDTDIRLDFCVTPLKTVRFNPL